jgi:Phospholipase_D-nuclease N-terminal
MHFLAFLSQVFTLGTFVFLSQILSLLGVAFCIWMIIDCLRNTALEGINKVLWLLLIIFVQPLCGALIYFAFGRSKKK